MFASWPDTMRAYAPSLMTALCLSLASGASVARAQSYTVTLREIDGKAYNTVGKPPISKAQCEAKATLSFQVKGLAGSGQNPKYMQVWAGASCNTDTRRDTTGKGCTEIADQAVASSAPDIPNFEISADKLCDSEGTRTRDAIADVVRGRLVDRLTNHPETPRSPR